MFAYHLVPFHKSVVSHISVFHVLLPGRQAQAGFRVVPQARWWRCPQEVSADMEFGDWSSVVPDHLVISQRPSCASLLTDMS
jgi:hypothetical protein